MTQPPERAHLNLRMRQRILKAATTLFVRKGFDGVSLGDIAKKLKINQSLIYHYFESKEDLWSQVKKPFLESYSKAHIEVIPALSAGLRPFLEKYLSSSLDYWFHHVATARLLRWDRLEEKGEMTAPTVPDPLSLAIEQLQKKGMLASALLPPVVAALLRSAAKGPFFAIHTPHCAQRRREKLI